jgi:hypothetical protein
MAGVSRSGCSRAVCDERPNVAARDRDSARGCGIAVDLRSGLREGADGQRRSGRGIRRGSCDPRRGTRKALRRCPEEANRERGEGGPTKRDACRLDSACAVTEPSALANQVDACHCQSMTVSADRGRIPQRDADRPTDRSSGFGIVSWRFGSLALDDCTPDFGNRGHRCLSVLACAETAGLRREDAARGLQQDRVLDRVVTAGSRDE